MVLSVAAIIFLGLAMIGAGINIAAAIIARPPGGVPALPGWPPITVLKPLHGGEPALAANLQSLFGQDYPGAVQIIFGTRNADDCALGVVAAMRVAFPDADIDIVVSDRRCGANNKLSNLANMDAVGRHPIVIIADSDVAWAPDTLRRLAIAVAEPGVGLASCLHIGRGDAGFWSQLAAMDISYRFMPSVLMGVALGMAKPALGPTMAFRRDTLNRIGGFAAFADVLADDYQIGRAVRALGLRSVISTFYITHGCAESSLRGLIAHEMRWTVTIFRIDPLGFAGSVVVHTLPLALIGAALAGFSTAGLAVLAAALGSRIVVKLRMDAASGAVSGALILLPLRDLLSFALFCATFFVHKVYWRGSQFRVTRDGRLQSR
ncbi:bacteriohopanetetrol glucosamine biosynthesis glycosyltransferase HpnI [Sphingomonas sp. 28-63-12]|uniref:bacteriohopanetetrol glucosamine biosynthesis glycosyltransferase HpnI n=1 Tax=Sphingomonas sp. 28-63-12 TaxID=1970434 RepID=UPI000BC3BF99|nr:MAG: hypothetical protein B7Y47_16690 [Sphingomonas sp. 28-63-12]